MIDTDAITKPVAAVTAVMAMIGGGYSLYDKIKLPPKDILKWDADHFSISNGPAFGVFKVTVLADPVFEETEEAPPVLILSTEAAPEDTLTEETLGASIVTTLPALPALLKDTFRAPVFLVDADPEIVTV